MPWWLYGAAAGLIGSLVVVIAFSGAIWASHGFGDRAAAIGAAAAVATLFDAAIAGAVAVAAYYQSTQKPDLQVLLGLVSDPWLQALPTSASNAPVFTVQRSRATYDQFQVRLALRNLATYSARNPAVRIKLEEGVAPVTTGGWVGEPGGEATQWDGGANQAVHGTWQRALPVLELTARGPARDEPYYMTVEVVAEGFRRDFIWLLKFVAG